MKLPRWMMPVLLVAAGWAVYANSLSGPFIFDDHHAIPDREQLLGCATASCHGAAAPRWGGTLTGGCFGCHSGTEQGYKPQNDYGTAGAPNPVDSGQYLYSGHGRTGSNYPGSVNPPAGFDNVAGSPAECYYCHAQAAPHTSKSPYDPFRLGTPSDNTFGGTGDFTGVFADNTDRLCLGCHGSASARAGHSRAATVTVNMQTHARGITGTKYTWPNSPWKCVDCHDPHGDGASGAERYMMVRSAINTPSGSTDTLAGSDAKSRPKRTVDANVRSISFNSVGGFAAGSYAQSGNGTGGVWGPCEVCHTQTNAYSRTIDNGATHATRTGRCTDCHGHEGGFAASGHKAGSACKGCHSTSISGTYIRRAIQPEFDNTYRHGSAWATLTSADCEKCHEETSADNVVRLKVWNANATAGTTSYTTVTYDNTNLASANAACISCHDADATKITFTRNV